MTDNRSEFRSSEFRQAVADLSAEHRFMIREVVRYERRRRGELVHIDVKKSGACPRRRRQAPRPGFTETQSGLHSKRSLRGDCLHVAVDDYSRYDYVEVRSTARSTAPCSWSGRLPTPRGAACAWSRC